MSYFLIPCPQRTIIVQRTHGLNLSALPACVDADDVNSGKSTITRAKFIRMMSVIFCDITQLEHAHGEIKVQHDRCREVTSEEFRVIQVNCEMIPFKCVSQWSCWQSAWGFSLVQLTFYDRPTHFLSHLPAVNKLHMLLGARLAAARASCSASQLTMAPDFAQWLHPLALTGCACVWLSRKNVSEEAPGQILHTHLILLRARQQWGLSEAVSGCRMRE